MNRMCIAVLACMAALQARAQDGVALAGIEGSNATHSAYLGTVRPLAGSGLGKGWVQRYWLDYTRYRYEKTPVQDIDASVVGAEVALGYQDSSESGWWSAYVGGRYGNTRLSPDDPANEDRGGDFSAKLQFEGETALSPGWRINGIVSHVVAHSNYWARVRLERWLGDGLRVGPEFVAQGDPLYHLHKIGVYVGGIRLGEAAALTVKLGASKLSAERTGAYAGVEWYMPY